MKQHILDGIAVISMKQSAERVASVYITIYNEIEHRYLA